MAARAGERAWRTCIFHCQTCGAPVRVQQDETIPECPNGHKTFDERTDESGNSNVILLLLSPRDARQPQRWRAPDP